jgi:hypothetical protein
MIEIGAGGGSIATVDDLGLLKVGPRSAGSVPGPVAYGRGGDEHLMTAIDIAGIESLTAWDTPALSNALDALRLRPHNTGYSDGSIQRITGAAPMAGRAVTARMVARAPGEHGIPVSFLHQAILQRREAAPASPGAPLETDASIDPGDRPAHAPP